MRKSTFLVAFLAASCVASAGTLDELESRANKANATPAGQAEQTAVTQDVLALVEGDGLKTGLDFARASKLVFNPFFRLELARVRHELTLAAVVLGHTDSMDQLAGTWDDVIVATGRRRPFGVRKLDFQTGPGERFEIDPAPKCVSNVLLFPLRARDEANRQKSNGELARLCKEDQAARSIPFAGLSKDQCVQLWQEDRRRFKKVIELVKRGAPRTGVDFERAALICQHGGTFDDYQLAHELALCAAILGSEDGSWLAGATYDRMMLSAGYPQRFATQFMNNSLEPVAVEGINDTVRKAVVHGTLADARRQERLLREQVQGKS